MSNKKAQFTLPFVALVGAVACGETTEPPPTEECAATFPEVATSCTGAACMVTTGTKTYSQAEVDPGSYVVVSWATSEINDNENIDLVYGKSNAGGLTARIQRQRMAIAERISPADYEILFGKDRLARLAGERAIRAADDRGPLDLSGVSGTGIRGRSADLLPEGVHRQSMACSQAAPACGTAAICVIPSGTTAGTCETMVQLKWRDQTMPTQFEMVNATVRKVGSFGAILTDDADTIAAADVDELSKRFEEHIAPIDHQLFGEPKDMTTGKDRDGNGVVIIFLSSKVVALDPPTVGFFQATDLRDPATVPGSNGADILYMQPKGAAITLDQLSGTIGHEYEHLISFVAKVQNRQSSQETIWLDEGLATFAEDVLGYGVDSYKNIGAYLVAAGDTSLTGGGLGGEIDSLEARGMANLYVRYFFEQKGGADFTSAAVATDKGGVAAVKALVQSAETGLDLWTSAKTGRAFDTWMADFMVAVAVDGANYPNVSCNTKYSFLEPETDAYTNFQRGIDLRKPIAISGGTIPLNGPATNTFEAESPPLPSNGGEVRTLKPTVKTKISIGGPAEDYKIGFRVVPTGS